MSLILFGYKTDMSSARNPRPGSYIIGYDLDGVLKQKDSNGNITTISGTGSSGTGSYIPLQGTNTPITGNLKFSDESSLGISNESENLYLKFSSPDSSMKIGKNIIIDSNDMGFSGVSFSNFRSTNSIYTKSSFATVQYSPNMIAASPNGTIYACADSGGFRVIETDGTSSSFSFVGGGSPPFSAFVNKYDSNSVLFANNSEFTNIHIYSSDIDLITTVDLGISFNSLSIDSDENFIYVMGNESGEFYIYTFNHDGTNVSELIHLASPDYLYIRPVFIVVDGIIYTATIDGDDVSRIISIDLNGVVNTISNITSLRTVNNPFYDIVCDGSNLYTLDAANQQIIKTKISTGVSSVLVSDLDLSDVAIYHNMLLDYDNNLVLRTNDSEKVLIFNRTGDLLYTLDDKSANGWVRMAVDGLNNIYLSRRFGDYSIQKYTNIKSPMIIGVDGNGSIIDASLEEGKNINIIGNNIDVKIPPKYTEDQFDILYNNNNSMVIDSNDNVYILDYNSNSDVGSILKYGEETPLAEMVDNGGLYHLILDSKEENLYFTRLNSYIYKFNIKTYTITQFDPTQFINTVGIAIDNNDNIYVAHSVSGDHYIKKITQEGVITTLVENDYLTSDASSFKFYDGDLYYLQPDFGLYQININDGISYTNYEFEFGTDFAFDSNHTLFIIGYNVGGTGNLYMKTFDDSGNIIMNNLSSPNKIFIDNKNNLYISQNTGNVIRIYFDGTSYHKIDLNSDNFGNPVNIVADSKENIYVLHTGKSNIFKLVNQGDILSTNLLGEIERKTLDDIKPPLTFANVTLTDVNGFNLSTNMPTNYFANTSEDAVMWVLPGVVESIGAILILVNKGSDTITISTNSGGNEYWSNGLESNTKLLSAGENVTLLNDGFHWVEI